MIKNAISLSQPLNSRSYHDYLSQKMVNPKANQAQANPAQIQGMPEQAQGAGALDTSTFASELRSQKTVSALMNFNKNSAFPPTLSERGAKIDKQGNIAIPDPNSNAGVQKNDASVNTLQNQAPTQAAQGQHVQRSQQINGANGATGAQGTHQVQEEQVLSNPAQRPVTPEVTERNIGIPINGRSQLRALAGDAENSMPLNGMRVFALDERSLGVLSKITEKKALTPLGNTDLHTLMKQERDMNKAITPQDKSSAMEENQKIAQEKSPSLIGSLAAQYESSTKGSSVIGYDRNGGTSYGTYQISSRAGSFDSFLNFLDKQAPEWANKLRDAGNANTGSRAGKVPDTWKALCAEDPNKMKKLEHDFIVESHYEPVASYVEEKWEGNISHALREVIFSTAVQHGVGGAKQVFNQAFADTPLNTVAMASNVNTKQTQDSAISLLMSGNSSGTKIGKASSKEGLEAQEELIRNVYAHRSTKFGSSSAQIQESARNRFVHEQKEALSILT